MSERHVHIVDDDAGVRRSMAILLRANGFTVDPWVSGTAFLERVDEARRGCILLDICMPGIDGPGVHAELTRRGIAMPIIVLTGHGDVGAAIRAMKAGAVDFLEKPVERSVLLAAVTSALERIEGLNRHHASVERARAAVAMLTAREYEVLEGLATGLSNKGIAQRLAISSRTVEIHRANAMTKLDVQSLSQALRIAFTAGIGEPSG